jgi:hypothetical protein
MVMNIRQQFIGIAAALAVSLALLQFPSGAAAEQAEPAARLHVVVKEIKIHDDREGFLSGQGEMNLTTRVWPCPEGIPPPCEDVYAALADRRAQFNASTGATVILDQQVPQEIVGFPLYPGQPNAVQFVIYESDGVSTDPEYMGEVVHVLDIGEHGLGLGTHTERSHRADGGAGDYTITYEIRPAPLADLRPVNIRLEDLPGGAKKRVCMAVQDIEIGHAGPFEVALQVDGVEPPDARASVSDLAPGNHTWACVETTLPTAGQHQLAAVVDPRRALVEFNETNNVYEQAYTAPAAAPSATEPDLVIGAIRVNGREPDGKDDCKEGKNDVVVVVQNASTASAGDFLVRLIVDDDGDAEERGVDDGLEAGQERELKFRDVTLKKGLRSLAATADSTVGIDESNEGNNTLEVTARCEDDD